MEIPHEATLLRIFIGESEEKIQSFLPVLDGMITGGLVTMEKVRALHYRGDTHKQ